MSQISSAVAAAAVLVRDWPKWPVYGLTDDLLPAIDGWTRAGHRVAMATLVRIVGSSPRPLGSEMAVCDSGEAIGYVSGGCVESAVAAEALAAMSDGTPRLLDYGAGSPVLDIQLTCGGRIGIFVRELVDAAEYVSRLRAARDNRQALEVHLDLRTGEQGYFTPGLEGELQPAPADPASVFVKPHLPPVRLMVVGSNPVALAVCQFAPQLGYEVGLLCPYGPVEPPPGLELTYYDRRPLEQALADQPLDAWTAVYALTHHPEEDLVVLAHALRSPAFAVGVLGSRSKIRDRLMQLSEAGVDEAAKARLRAPAGLGIGARGPREIALSILGEVVSLQPRAACRPSTDQAASAADTQPTCSRSATPVRRTLAR